MMKRNKQSWYKMAISAALCAGSMLTASADTRCVTPNYPGTASGGPSYFDVTIGNSIFDAWCGDSDMSISKGQVYTAEVLQISEAIAQNLFENSQNMSKVLYVLNKNYPGTSAGGLGTYSWGDVQTAIWQLIDNNGGGGATDTNSERVDAIIADANANGASYTPPCDGKTLLVLRPIAQGCTTTETGPTVAQLILMEVPVECTASIGDQVWVDTNGNGIQDQGESGFNGIGVSLLDCSGKVLAVTTTDPVGNYLFKNLKPGDYKIKVELPNGYTFTQQNQGANDSTDSDADASGNMECTTLTSGENDLTWDAGLVQEKASIGDYVWFDADKDGIQDADESGVAGVTVELYACDGDQVGTATTTDANGKYSFTGLNPGSYYVKFALPSGYGFTPKNQGSDGSKDSDVDVISGETVCTELAAGENDLTWDAGLYTLPARIGDRVWYDTNANGIQDEGEPGIKEVLVTLYNCDGVKVADMLTDAAGNYLFENLAPGSYKVQFTAPVGYTITLKDQGANDGADSDADASGLTACTTLEAAESDLTWDAGMYLMPASIGNLVWEDTNKNGVQDAGEQGVAGVTVKLTDCAGNVLKTTTTDATGQYLFSELYPGDYAIEFGLPAGYSRSTKDVGGDDAVDSDAGSDGKTACTTLAAGENDMSWDAGIWKTPTYTNPGTGTPGYWMNHPEAWPVDSITLGGRTYTKAEAITFIKRAVKGDKRYTLFAALVCAKLNGLIGNDTSCVAGTIEAADAWWNLYGGDLTKTNEAISGNSPAWKLGEPLYLILDNYNNGRLCAPHRD